MLILNNFCGQRNLYVIIDRCFDDRGKINYILCTVNLIISMNDNLLI